MSTQKITVPDLGGSEGVEIIEICVAVGDSVEAEQSLITIETDKATVDVPCPAGGKITALAVSVGDKVSEGDEIGTLEVGGAADAAPAVKEETKEEPKAAPAAEAPKAAAPAKAVAAQATVPDGVEGAEVIEISVAVGDTIAEGDTIAVLETDKATVDVPANAAGKITAVKIKVGDQISSGDLVLELEGSASAAPQADAEPAKAAEPEAAPAPAAESAPASTGPVQATVPDGIEDAEVIEVTIAAGDTIAEGDTVAVLETDKATVDVPATAAGKVTAVKISVGDKISSGHVVAELEGSAPAAAAPAPAPKAETSAPAPAKAAPAAPAAKAAVPDTSKEIVRSASEVYAGPAVRTHARDLGVDLKDVKATGPRNRVLKEDVDNYVKNIIKQQKAQPAGATATGGSGIPAMPSIDFSKFGDVEIVKMSKIQKITAFNMQRNWLNIPAVTQFDDADITDLEVFRKGLKAEAEKRGVKLTPLPFLLKACAAALRAEPTFNVSLTPDGESMVKKDYVHIGIAADTPNGLMVPVIRDVDKKGLWQLAEEANAIIAKARAGKLTPSDMQGGCFTISSLGAMGGNGFTPIVNAPEVAILGVSRAQMKPVWDGKEFIPRNMLPLALSYDHRAINGADCGRFFTYLVSVIADVRRLLL